jgi:hypothetical protein
MKKFLILYTLYFYKNYIVEDFSIYKKFGYYLIYPAWIIRSIIFWLLYPLFIPKYLFEQSKYYRFLNILKIKYDK